MHTRSVDTVTNSYRNHHGGQERKVPPLHHISFSFLTIQKQVWTTVYRYIERILLIDVLEYYAYYMHGLQKQLFDP